MAVDNNFERLETEVNRLLEVLEHLKEENASQQSRIEALEKENAELKSREQSLGQVRQDYEQALEQREAARSGIEKILARLDQVQF